MYFLNLTLAQFVAVAGAATAALVLLYLLDRSRRRQIVATLRFWVAAEQPVVVQKRKKIQQPLSLILQLVSVMLLLAAIAQLRLGTPLETPRDHVLILDTSAWMSAASASARSGRRTLMDDAREKARAYVKSVPATDRIMLVRADAMAMPATAFERDRKKLEQAIFQSAPGATALSLDGAIAFARQAQVLGSRRAGEIVYVGPGRIAGRQPLDSGSAPKNLRVIAVQDSTENCGLRRFGARKSGSVPDVWDIYALVKNYGAAARVVTLSLTFGGVPVAAQRIAVAPGSEHEATFEFRTHSAGVLEATLLPHDAFPADDHAALELSPQPSVTVTVYSAEPDLLRPLVAAMPRVHAVFKKTSEYRAGADKSIVILDRFKPPAPPAADAIWIDPPPDASPVPIRSRAEGAPFQHWCGDNPLCAGLRAKDLRLNSTSVFECAPGDIRIGQIESGPVVVARPGLHKTVVFGFHPDLSDLRYELAEPLLFANILRWMAPDLFRRSTLAAGSAGMVMTELDADVRPEQIRVLDEDGTSLPFTTQGHTLRFFAGNPGTVRVLTADRETVYSLTLPELWETKWVFPAGVNRGLPAFRERAGGSRDLWELLAVLGGLGLLIEWLLYGRANRVRTSRAQLAILRPRIRRKAS